MENTAISKEEAAFSRRFTTGGLLKFALPSIITLLFASVYSIVDGVYVSSVGGKTAFAAINLASPIFAILASLGFMLGAGGNALVAKTLGEGDKKRANRIYSLLTYTVIGTGILVTVLAEIFYEPGLQLLGATDNMMQYCLPYGRIILPFMVFFMLQFYFQSMMVTAGKPKLGLVMMLIAGFTNIIGDTVLVGFLADSPTAAVTGAAWATSAGLLVGGLVPLLYFFLPNGSLLRLGAPGGGIRAILQASSNGISEFLSNVSASIVNTVYNGLLLYYIGEMGVAAYGSISYLNTIFTAIFIGFSIGVAPVIGYQYGAKLHTELKNTYRKSMAVTVILSIVMTVGAELLSSPLAALFSSGEEALYEMTVTGFYIFSVSFLIKGINTFGSAFFTSLNNGLISGILSVSRSLIFNIAAVIIIPVLCYLWIGDEGGLLGVWWATTAAELAALVMTLIFLGANRKRYSY